MSKPLSSFPEGDRYAVAMRRAKAETGGLGELSAKDYLVNRKPTKVTPAAVAAGNETKEVKNA